MHSHFFTLIVLLQFMHVTTLSPGTMGTGLPHLSFVHAASTVRLLPTNSGQHIFGFNLIFISSSCSIQFLITSSDKIGISSISSDTIAKQQVLWIISYQKDFLDLSCEISTFCLLQLIVSFPPMLLCLCHQCGQIKLPHVDYWSYQVIQWFSFQVEILSTLLYQIFLNFVL